jgi:hypothetical protein
MHRCLGFNPWSHLLFIGKVLTLTYCPPKSSLWQQCVKNIYIYIVLIGIFSGGRPEGSKRNLKFQSAMWHHFKHFQSKDFFSCCLFFTALELFCHNYMKNP